MKPGINVVQTGEAHSVREGERLVTRIPLQIKKRGARVMLIAPSADTNTEIPASPDRPLLIAVARAFYWQRLIDDGKVADAEALTRREKLDRTFVNETLRFTLLAPDIVRAILAGTQPRTMALQDLRRRLPLDWDEQMRHFGFDAA